ncbi:hypothetical protein [Bacillus sp. YC2]|uniref:hypothetical protein n=1 Tax=Bacillus sp. YC2 TaxID=2861287 RepID=UPI00223AE90F|nr:hypothetical protein [Bacillus sp. YC2]
MTSFKPEKVRLVRHGAVEFSYTEINDACLIAADTVALFDFNSMGGGRFAAYDEKGLTKLHDGYHLYDDKHPKAFVFEFPNT